VQGLLSCLFFARPNPTARRDLGGDERRVVEKRVDSPSEMRPAAMLASPLTSRRREWRSEGGVSGARRAGEGELTVV
jgi:hypothetical protein